MAHEPAAMARAVTPAAALDAALAEMQGPVRWGVADCCSSACLAFERLWRVPVWPLVPDYGTRLGALRLIAANGGAREWTAALAAAAGLRARDQHAGALGLYLDGSAPITLAVCVGDRWAVRADEGGMALRQAVPAVTWGV